MEKEYLSLEEYKAVVEEYRSRYDYDQMSEEEQTVFDERLDKVIGMSEPETSEKTDAGEQEKIKEALREHYGYDDMSDEQKESFDKILDKELAEHNRQAVDNNLPDRDRLKEEYRDKYGYENLSDEQKVEFDERLDEAFGVDESAGDGDENPDPPVHKLVLRKR